LLHNTFGYDKSVLMSTGFEAADTAVKFARRWGYNIKKVPDN
jgi:ornithine--oxo-acid transaminase